MTKWWCIGSMEMFLLPGGKGNIIYSTHAASGHPVLLQFLSSFPTKKLSTKPFLSDLKCSIGCKERTRFGRDVVSIHLHIVIVGLHK